jgi:glycerate kinase
LKLLKASEYNPLKTSTFGTGELIKHALENGVSKIILGIGGSATNDGGIGVAAALGYRFLDENKDELQPSGENLLPIKKIQSDNVVSSLVNVKFWAMCDVQNPLTGPIGASAVFGPQKGATNDQVTLLDEGLANLGRVIESDLNLSIRDVPGAGAGGGIGGGAIAFLGAELKSGIELVMELSNFEHEVMLADLVITGEGKMDSQTLQGKVVAGVAAIARKHNTRVIVIAGRNELNNDQQQSLPVEKIFALTDYESEEAAIQNAYGLLATVSGKYLVPVI